MRPPALILYAASVLASVAGCRGHQPASTAPAEDASWAVTAWGERHEVFAETDGLVAGQTAVSHAHVTLLADFSPLRSGSVTIVLRSPNGHEHVFRTTEPSRDGIFPVEIETPSSGEFDLLFRLESDAGREEIAAGRVRVGTAAEPGALPEAAPEAAPDTVPFLKEQQWRTRFASAWAEEGSLHDAVSGPARVRPVAGGEAVLTAPADATVASEPWPHVGLPVRKGAALFRLVPRVGDRSLPDVQADVAALEADVAVARQRVQRLEGLLEVEATSPAELERARAGLVALQARLAAAQQGVRATDSLDGSARSVEIAAPWAGRVAEVSVSPGQTVAAGAPLGRVVRVRPLWLAVALRPADAARLRAERLEVEVRRSGEVEPLRRAARLVSRAPEIDSRTATLAVVLELDASASELPIGSSVEADLLLPSERQGVVVPLTTLVQDAGTTVVYVQLAGETFARREVHVLARQGGAALVEGLRPRERVVTLGGAAVRRSSLLSSGAPEGHVH